MVPPILPDVQVQPRRSLGDEQQLGPRRELPCCQPLRRQELPHSELLVSSWEGAQVSEGSRAPGRMGCVGHLLSEVLLVHLSLGNAGSQADRSPAKSFWVWGGVQGHVGGLGVPIPQQKLPRGNALGDDKGRLITIVHVHCRWGAFPPFPSSDTRALESVCKWVCVCVYACVCRPLSPGTQCSPGRCPRKWGSLGGAGSGGTALRSRSLSLKRVGRCPASSQPVCQAVPGRREAHGTCPWPSLGSSHSGKKPEIILFLQRNSQWGTTACRGQLSSCAAARRGKRWLREWRSACPQYLQNIPLNGGHWDQRPCPRGLIQEAPLAPPNRSGTSCD